MEWYKSGGPGYWTGRRAIDGCERILSAATDPRRRLIDIWAGGDVVATVRTKAEADAFADEYAEGFAGRCESCRTRSAPTRCRALSSQE